MNTTTTPTDPTYLEGPPRPGADAVYPRFVSFVAVALGCFDLLRGFVHTALAGSTAVAVSGIDISGPSGGDQIMLMAAFGHANFITGAALIYQGVFNRAGALFLMCIIPLALAVAGLSVNYWAADLPFQGRFPGRFNMMIYGMVCMITAALALTHRWRWSRRLTHETPSSRLNAS